MKTKRLDRTSSGDSSSRVTLEFTHATAKSVSVAGTFNDWRPGATEMLSLGKGRWRKSLMLPPGTYEYRFVADGEWIADPRAADTSLNPFGEVNSILRVHHRSEVVDAKSKVNRRISKREP